LACIDHVSRLLLLLSVVVEEFPFPFPLYYSCAIIIAPTMLMLLLVGWLVRWLALL